MGPNQQKLPPGKPLSAPGDSLERASELSATTTAVTETTLAETLIILRKRKWMLLLFLVLGTAYGYYKVISAPKLYEATGRIQVRAGAANEFRVDAAGASGGDSLNRMGTEAAILQSDSLLLTVARQLDLANNPEFLGAKGRLPHRDLNDPAVRQSTLGGIRGGLSVQPISRTDIIAITFKSLNPKLSADVVNTIINDYIQRSFQTRFSSTQRVSEWLSSQLDDLKEQVETSQEQLMGLQKRLGITSFDASKSLISSELDDLTRAASEARIQSIIAEAKYRVLASSDPNSGNFSDLNGNPVLIALRSQQAGLATQFAQLDAQYGPNYIDVKKIRAQLAEVEKAIQQEQARSIMLAKQAFVAAHTNEDMTNAALEGEKGDAYKMRDDLLEYQIREREFESQRGLYEGLLQRLRAAGIQAGLESSEIDIVDIAMIPASPSSSSTSSTILTNGIFSLLAGIVLAFLLESLDTGLSSVAEIEAITELPSLAIIPKARRIRDRDAADHLTTAQKNIYVLNTPKSQFAESFRALRTSLLLSTAGHPPQVILVTSATPAEGKTTIATNIACVLAQRDARVLLIDADLRRPTVHHRFGLEGKTGLTTVLTGASTLEAALQHVPDIPNLDVLACGPVPPFPTEMLGSESMASLLERCTHLYTHIVLDSPPILSVTDGVILARLSDAVALVVRHGKPTKHVVRRARDLLIRAGAPITGVVLNAVDLNSPEYYGYYGNYNYSYYSSDSSGWETGNGASTTRLRKPEAE